MMEREPQKQPRLFYTRFNLDQRISANHPLRAIDQIIDFDFIYDEVRDAYGHNGNVSVPPPVILKMMLLLVMYNVRSERELMDTIPMRLDWMWFLGYDLDDQIPNHSVLSKARNRWGAKAFKYFFERIVGQCAQAGLIDGSKVFMDASLMEADASNNSVVNQQALGRYLNARYRELEAQLEQDDDTKSGKANRKHVSTTDPDASVVRQGGGRSKLRYKIHRAVDEKAEVITATEVTPGEVNEAHRLSSLIESHEANTGRSVETAVADSKYGTIDNFLACCDRHIAPHFEALDKSHRGKGRRKDIFEPQEFVYNPEDDLFICPAGELLLPRKVKKKRQHIEYAATAKICNRCALKHRCTRSKQGRTLKRHLRQEALEQMLAASQSRSSRRDIRKRQHLMERSFAQASRYGFDRARWRRLWRVRIQEYLVAAIQNIRILTTHFKDQRKATAMRVAVPPANRHIQVNSTSGGLFERLLGHLRQAYSNLRQFPLSFAIIL
jgi:transposase